jgi:NAD-dependent deacetylase
VKQQTNKKISMFTTPNIVILTGAGISAESGIKTFRDNDGLWENHHIEDVATPQGFDANPSLVYRFYNQRRKQLLDSSVKPNPAHIALAQLQTAMPDHVTVVTQNVDDLHEQAGSKNVIHMHGTLRSARCLQCATVTYWEGDFDSGTECPCCHTTSLRPDIVWFGEMPMHMDEIEAALLDADIFIAIGTSGNVYPAAGFVQYARDAGAVTIEANLVPSTTHSLFDRRITGPASQTIPTLVSQILTDCEGLT